MMSAQLFNPSRSSDSLRACLLELLPSEWKLLLLVADDLSKEEIVATLYICPKSVETYLTRMRDKLRMKGKDELFRFARKNKEALKIFYAKIY